MNSILATIQNKFELDSGHNVVIPVKVVRTPTPHLESEHIYIDATAGDVYDALMDLFKHNNVQYIFDTGESIVKLFMVGNKLALSGEGTTILTYGISITSGIDIDEKTYYFIKLKIAGSE